MTKLLIASRPDDTHAHFVKLAMEKYGHSVDILYPADFPSQLTHSLYIKNNKFSWQADGKDCELQQTDYDVVWYRRPLKPFIPNYIHPDDLYNVKKENNLFAQNLWRVIFPNTVWINPVNASINTNCKLLQLKIADNCQLKIPNTLISNDPTEIKFFIVANEAKVIYKTIHPMAWYEDNCLSLTYADDIAITDLPSDPILQVTPGIYQRKIPKDHELRITYMGDRYIAVKIDSQAHELAKADWRYAPTKQLSLEQVSLPKSIDQACREMMQKLGIVFGCFDFIVTPDGEYYFLEVNEQGQFLWIEDVNPDIKLLQPFIEFVTNINHSNKIIRPMHVALSDFNMQAQHCLKHAIENHINPPLYN